MARNVHCEAGCDRFFASEKALLIHLKKSRACSLYLKGKMRDLGDANDLEPILLQDMHQEEEMEFEESMESLGSHSWLDDILDVQLGAYEDKLHFWPENLEDTGAGPGPQTAANRILRHFVFDENEDERFVLNDRNSGKILRHESPPTYMTLDDDGDTLMGEGQESNPFSPFSSELDWRVAQWAVEDEPGHNAFNRLLEIPGVSQGSSAFIFSF